MGLATRIASRSLRGHPGRTLFSVLGVAVGIATVVAVFTLDHVTVLSRTRDLAPDFGADLEVRATGEAPDPRAELLALEGVAGVAAFFQNDVGLRPLAVTSGDDRARSVRLVGLETGTARTLGVYHVESGEDLSAATAADGVLIGARLADDLALAVGDAVVLTQPRSASGKRCVDGVLQEEREEARSGPPRERVFRVIGVLAREGLGRRAGGRVVVVDFDAGRDLLRDVLLESQFWVRRSEATDLEVLEADLARTFTFQRNETRAVGQMADERAFRNGVRLAGLFALLLGLFVIFHTLSMSLVERVREVGNLHALGATRVQIGRVFFVEALVVALCAGALGLMGGVGLAALLLSRGISTLGVTGHPVRPFEVPWRIVVPLVALGVAMALVGSVYPILRARGTDVVAALRGEERGRRTVARGFQLFSTLLLVGVVPAAFFRVVPVVGAAGPTLVWTLVLGLVVLGLSIGLPLLAPSVFGRATARLARPLAGPFPLVGKLVVRNLAHGASRIGGSLAALALVTAAFVGLKGMTRSLEGETLVWASVAAGDKVWVEGLPDVPFDDVVETLHALPEVRGVESRDAYAFPSFLVLGLRSEEIGGWGPLAADPALRAAFEDGQGIVLSSRLARQRGLSVGDKVLMRTTGHGAQEFDVLSISDAYGYFLHPYDERAFGVVSEELLVRYFCVDVERTSSIAVKVGEEGDVAAVAAALRARFPAMGQVYLYDEASIGRILLEDLAVDFVLFDVILLLTALLAGLGVLNGQLLAALERRKELGVLRALGTTRAQVAGAVLVESATIGGVGGLLGALVGSGLTPVLVSSLRVLSGLPLPLRFAGLELAGAVLGALALALFAGLYPLWRMNRFDAVRAVRTG